MKLKGRYILGIWATLAVLCVLAAVSPVVYGVLLWAARAVLVVYSAQKATELARGVSCDLLDFLVGVGGVLYVGGLVAELLGCPLVNGRDLDFLVRVVGGAFLILPLALAGLPQRARRALGVGAC